ncbi:MAG: hypothetical protein EZS28_003019 [Streblomastix strix]|uniref:Uncharacterized protein n=1 Tax=Streblomastix strix TaxID=222440 RepID=A0A5J4X289_9EUKA|nr:MAG: hypothetical protein EZS28_003016 [Streblomastix strix]KAA6401457.1 MAG: hypothetical protein EZS28_003019 [Streblomastix strix]
MKFYVFPTAFNEQADNNVLILTFQSFDTEKTGELAVLVTPNGLFLADLVLTGLQTYILLRSISYTQMVDIINMFNFLSREKSAVLSPVIVQANEEEAVSYDIVSHTTFDVC